jgi:hypothetical protein
VKLSVFLVRFHAASYSRKKRESVCERGVELHCCAHAPAVMSCNSAKDIMALESDYVAHSRIRTTAPSRFSTAPKQR